MEAVWATKCVAMALEASEMVQADEAIRKNGTALAEIADALKRLLSVDWAAAIDRCFRYLQMLVVSALFTGLTSVLFKAPAAEVVSMFLCLAAGLYLAIPLARWLIQSRYGERKAMRRLTVAAMAIALSTTSYYYSSLAVALVAHTVRVQDTRDVHAQMREWELKMAKAACVRGGTTWKQTQACFARAEREFWSQDTVGQRP